MGSFFFNTTSMVTIPDLYNIYLNHPVITTDSRNIPAGSLFFALRGDHFDGNTFAAEALSKGAAYAIVDDPGIVSSDRMIITSNCLQTLQQLAAYHRQNHLDNTRIIALTGSNGKTTTKELIKSVIATQFRVQATIGNLNNHIGVPLTLLATRPETEIAIIEMGANHPGEIHELCTIADPELGLITNIGKAHLKGFGSFEGVVNAKTEMYRYLAPRKGTAFISLANPVLSAEIEKYPDIKKVFYNHMMLQGEVSISNGKLIAEIRMDTHSFRIRTQLTGKYNLENILAAIAIGQHFGVSVKNIIDGIEGYTPGNMRSQLQLTPQGNTLILDAYNANPSSMAAAIDNLKEMPDNSKLAILGEMLELGEYAQQEHLTIVNLLKSLQIPFYLVGKCFAPYAEDSLGYFDTAEELASHLTTHPIRKTCILIKGSRSNKLEKIASCL